MTLNELPGAELVLPGLLDLQRGEMNTVQGYSILIERLLVYGCVLA